MNINLGLLGACYIRTSSDGGCKSITLSGSKYEASDCSLAMTDIETLEGFMRR